MAKKKSDQDDKSAEQRELERRVDAMMSVERPGKAAPEVAPEEVPTAEPPETAAGGQATAPQLPAKLLKSLGVSRSTKKKTAKAEPAAQPADDTANDPPKERVLKLHVDEDAKLPEITGPENADGSPDPETELPNDPLADTETDKAVDDITAHEADLQLAVDDARARRRNQESEAEHQKSFLAAVFTSFWTWLIILGIAGVLWAWFR